MEVNSQRCLGRFRLVIVCLSLAFGFGGGTSTTLFAAENLGLLDQPRFLLQPQLKGTQQREGGFGLAHSYYLHAWRFAGYSVAMGVGTADLVRPASLFTQPADGTVAISDFYLTESADWGVARIGYLPVYYSLEGGGESGEPLTLLSYAYRHNWFPLRNLGVQAILQSDGYRTAFAIFNGEGIVEQDNMQWMSGHWAYQSTNGWVVGIAGLTGGTSPASTGSSQETYFKVAERARHRWGALFVRGRLGTALVRGEGYVGEVLQQAQIYKRGSWYIAVQHALWRDWRSEFMYEQAYPDSASPNSDREIFNLNFVQVAPHGTSQTMLILRHQLARDGSAGEDEVRLVWRISPQIQNSNF